MSVIDSCPLCGKKAVYYQVEKGKSVPLVCDYCLPDMPGPDSVQKITKNAIPASRMTIEAVWKVIN